MWYFIFLNVIMYILNFVSVLLNTTYNLTKLFHKLAHSCITSIEMIAVEGQF